MTLYRVHKTESFYETINIWEGEADTGKYVTTINGLNMAGTTKEYYVCVRGAVHTLALSEYNNNGWTQGSYMDIKMGDVVIGRATLDSNSMGEVKIYRNKFLLSLIFSPS